MICALGAFETWSIRAVLILPNVRNEPNGQTINRPEPENNLIMMDDDAGAESADQGVLLRLSLMAILLVVTGIGLWMWDDNHDKNLMRTPALVVSQNR
jgi:hypothetical protein